MLVNMRKPKSKPISDETKSAILGAAWSLIAEQGRADVGLAEIAAAAGVSRQTLFYAFGGRAELLVAMVRHRDAQTDHVARIRAAARQEPAGREAILAMVQAWLDYLPVIYPVGILLDAAALTDAAAREAWDDRMIGALLAGFRGVVRRADAAGPLGRDPDRLAEEIWACCHPSAWRRLVVECAWTPEDFRRSRLATIRALLGVRAEP